MMRQRGMGLAACAGLLAVAAPAAADDAPGASANQVAGLFMQSCVQFAGDKAGLRGWASRLGLATLPAEVQQRFLNGGSGVVFDASNAVGKYVVVSEDGGACSVIAAKASGADAATDLEHDLTAAGIAFNATGETSDPEEKALRHREYLASRGGRGWRLRLSMVKSVADGQVMLTAERN